MTRSSVALSSLTLAALITLVAGSLLQATGWRLVCAGALAAVGVVAWLGRDESATVVAGTGFVVLSAPTGVVSSIWVAAVAAGLAVLFFPRLRAWFAWVRRGTLDTTAKVVAATTVVVASGALWVWAAAQPRFGDGATVTFGEPSVLDRVIDLAQEIPLWLFPAAAVAFAVFNAAAEEFVYRGILLQALLPGGPTMAIVLQAVAFGAVHLHGFPGGWWGVAMTTVYGVALGWLRVHTRGIAAPFAVHVAADLVIAWLVRLGFA